MHKIFIAQIQNRLFSFNIAYYKENKNAKENTWGLWYSLLQIFLLNNPLQNVPFKP